MNEDTILNPNVDNYSDFSSISSVLNSLNKKKKTSPLLDPTSTESDRWLSSQDNQVQVEDPMDSIGKYTGLASLIQSINEGKQTALAKQEALRNTDDAMIQSMKEQMNEDPDVARARREGRQLTTEERERVSGRAEAKNPPKVANFWKDAIVEPIEKVFGF